MKNVVGLVYNNQQHEISLVGLMFFSQFQLTLPLNRGITARHCSPPMEVWMESQVTPIRKRALPKEHRIQ